MRIVIISPFKIKYATITIDYSEEKNMSDKDISVLLEDAKKKIQKTQKLQKQLDEELDSVFNFLVDNAFNNIPSLMEIQWDQYAPFELGTEFSVNQVYFNYDDDNDEEVTAKAYEFLDVLENFLYKNEAFLYKEYGNSQVTITREGVSLGAVEDM